MSRVVATVLVPGGSTALVDVGPEPVPERLQLWHDGLLCRVVGLSVDACESTARFEPAP